MSKILVTGFDPFGGETVNPAWETVKLLPDCIEGNEVLKLEIPTVFGKGAGKVISKIEEEKPAFVFLIGQAGGRSAVTPETTAYNRMDARIPDNEGNEPKEMRIIQDAPETLHVNVPVAETVDGMKKDGYNIEVSDNAGRFVCNELLYRVIDHLSGTKVKYDFVHVPFLPSQAKEGVASMELEEIKDTLLEYIRRTVRE